MTDPQRHSSGGRLTVREITSADFDAIERLFGAKGGWGGCWCMYWRVPSLGRYWTDHKGAKNRAAFHGLVKSGRARGCLAFCANAPIGWVSCGPREDFAYLARSRSIPASTEPGVWSITCFYIAPTHRGQGLCKRLIASAARMAKREGASWLEAYPTEPRSAGAIPPAFAYTGLPGPFRRLGFERAASAGSRTVMRLSLCSKQS